ncbi:BQ5605_C015g07967 [Microbotryum silenes-dioicae]|uniref:BQ5605_C015g07967 protein n=1 Tax=Microbotryum silenes-dioicae TaxID=796604 RepID=A0A2X0LXY7_9BASI|nr:BQ5605_C015g07967 [Microbotryum silenes-dioicae]
MAVLVFVNAGKRYHPFLYTPISPKDHQRVFSFSEQHLRKVRMHIVHSDGEVLGPKT